MFYIKLGDKTMKNYDIIMDMDPGIDDAVALTLALHNSNLNLKLITTVAGNVSVEKTTINALKITNFFNKDIPIVKGASHPLIKKFEDASHVHGESGMDGYNFDKPTNNPIDMNAVNALYQTIKNNDKKVILIPTGAFTNIALLLTQYPDVKSNIEKIVFMGGSVHSGNMTSVAEFNMFSDPHAGKIMINSGLPLVMVGLDVTKQALLTNDTLEKIKPLGPVGKMLYGIISHDFDHSDSGTAVHDANTIFYLLHPEAFQTKDYWIDVVTEGPALGATVADVRSAYHTDTNVSVCLKEDQVAFNNWILQEIKKIADNY